MYFKLVAVVVSEYREYQLRKLTGKHTHEQTCGRH